MSPLSQKRPIGVFDSGVGGLTVFKEIRRQFPHEDIIYFGDTARVPYGPKSRNTVIDYSVQNTRFLAQMNAKVIVVACNTSASVALDVLAENFDLPMIGVIEPGAYWAQKKTRNNRIGVIGTEGTIRSDAYRKAIQNLYAPTRVISVACPLLVPLVEEGWEDHPVTEVIAREYLSDMLTAGVDTIVLGCTHYPILKKVIANIAGPGIVLVDSAEAIASQLNIILPDRETSGTGTDRFFVSDNEAKFRKIAERILNTEVSLLEHVSLGETWNIVTKRGSNDA